ncbi:MAG: hypothetical protein AAF228_08150 [Pseudomonadota bacterium]
MKPIFMLTGLVLGAFCGAYLATTIGADYIHNLSFESPDEQSNLYNLIFLGSAGCFSLIGLGLGWLMSAILTRKKV